MEVTFLFLHGAGCDAAVDLLLEDQEQDQHRQQRDDHAGADQVVLAAHRAGEGVQRDGDGLQIRVLQVKVGGVVLVVHTDALQDGAGHDRRLQQRQQDLVVDGEVGGAVHDGGLIQGGRDVLEELDEHVDGDHVGAASSHNVAPHRVDGVEVDHHLVQRDLHGDARKQCRKGMNMPRIRPLPGNWKRLST